MKRIFILLLSALLVNSLFAQSNKLMRQPAKHNQVLNGLLQMQSANKVAMKTTGIRERVIAQSTHDSTSASLNDSVNLKYGPNRGSIYDYNTMNYPYNYPYCNPPMFNYAGTFTTPQVLFDTLCHWTVDPNTLVYGYYETDLAGYDAIENLTNYKALYADSTSSPHPNLICANNFNAAHLIDTAYASNWMSGIVDSSLKQYFTYNTSNKLIKDSMYELHLGVWRIVSKAFYTYDVSNNLIQIDCYENTTDSSFLLPLPEQLKYVNTYDVSNRLLTVLDSTFDGTSLAQNKKDTFAYTGAYPFHTSWKQYQWDAINHYWAPMFYMTKHLNGSSLPDTVNIKSFDSLLNAWVPQTMDLIHYNTSNDPDTLKDYEYNYSTGFTTPKFRTIYYYQTYVNAGNHIIYANNNQVKVFPNPATNTITISQLDVPENSAVSITMLNMNGQMVSRESMPWHSETQISIHDLASGIYWLVIQDGTGHLLHRQEVVKE